MDIAERLPFRHEAFIYHGDEQFVRGVAAFAAEGAGEAVLVAVTGRHTGLLRDALAGHPSPVEFLDLAEIGPNPGRIVSVWQEWTERNTAAGRGFRGVYEPVLAGRGDAELAEHRRHDHLLDLTFRYGPAWSLRCPFDAEALPTAVVDGVRRTHPLLFDGRGRTPSPTYTRPESALETVYSAPLPEPERLVAEFGFDVGSLAQVRGLVRRCASALGLEPAQLIDFTLVASELATNSVRHGGGSGVLRLWREGPYAVCEVRDRGTVTDPLVGLRRPDFRKGAGGAGLWAINRVCALVAIRSTPREGTVVRAHLALGR
jgi:anti-sigma regulatory factor (Ser/Thr protein kinase)